MSMLGILFIIAPLMVGAAIILMLYQTLHR